MRFLYFWSLLLVFSSKEICSETIETFYGSIEVDEPVLIELIHSQAFERLKHLHQYGVSYYTKSHLEEYTRYAHSLGVFAILRLKEAPLEEQIAGLLHDVSHTAFSHVGDWVFARKYQGDDYQSSIHSAYLTTSGIETILKRHGYTVEQICPYKETFRMLEQPLPNLCADRIDYNIQGAYFQKMISYEEAQKIVSNLTFESGEWIFHDRDLAVKLSLFSLFMTETCWGSAGNAISSTWLAEAILQGLQIGLFSADHFHFGVDQEIWDFLSQSKDPYIQDKMKRLESLGLYYEVTAPSQAEIFLPFKCRGIDPWIKENGQIVRLTSTSPELEEAFQKTKMRSLQGWPVRWK